MRRLRTSFSTTLLVGVVLPSSVAVSTTVTFSRPSTVPSTTPPSKRVSATSAPIAYNNMPSSS